MSDPWADVAITKWSSCLLVFQYVTHAEVIGHLEYNGISHRGEMSVQMPALWGRQPENDLWPNGVFNPIFPPQFYSLLIRSHPPYEHFNIVNRKLCREDYKVLSYCLLKGSNSGRLPVVLYTDGGLLNITYQLCGLERFLSHTFATIRLQDSVEQ